MNLRTHLLLLLSLGVSLLASCSSTPATRAQQRPAALAALPAKQQPTVLAGQITEGMTKDAVWIAWGSPSNISQAGENGTKLEIWRYTGLHPIYRPQFGMGYGIIPHGYGRNRHYHVDPFYNMNYGPDYVPYTAAVVKFLDGKVKAWER